MVSFCLDDDAWKDRPWTLKLFGGRNLGGGFEYGLVFHLYLGKMNPFLTNIP